MTVVPIEVARFWAKVRMPSPAACWTWQGARMGRDNCYGKFGDVQAHRYAYQVHCGPIPDGLMVRHLCGVKLCVNPRHLALGTAKDNYADRHVLGEATGGVGEVGEANPKAKLTEEQVRYILDNPDGLANVKLALKFGVSRATVTLIKQGKRWGWLQGDAA